MTSIETLQSQPTPTRPEIWQLIADALDVDISEIDEDLSVHDLPEWSSLEHVNLMIAIEQRFGVIIEAKMTADLRSVGAIEQYLTGRRSDKADAGRASGNGIARGLDGVVFDETEITSIDGGRGELLYRGYPIEEIAAGGSYEEICHLILHGERPTPTELGYLKRCLGQQSSLTLEVADLVRSMAHLDPLAVMRTAVSAIGASDSTVSPSPETVIAEGLDLIAKLPTILGLHHTTRMGLAWPEPDPDQTHAERFLTLFFGQAPSYEAVQAIDLTMRLHAEHGANASAFAARVTAGTEADTASTMVAALATFGGPLHGGAVGASIQAVREVADPKAAESYVQTRRANHQPIHGFGHRVYKVVDPRVAPLRQTALELANARPGNRSVATMQAIEEAMARYERHGLTMNVDAYSAVIFDLLGVPDEYQTALYAMSRAAGWTAQVAEQVGNNVLIRPRLAYVGPPRRGWEPTATESNGHRP